MNAAHNPRVLLWSWVRRAARSNLKEFVFFYVQITHTRMRRPPPPIHTYIHKNICTNTRALTCYPTQSYSSILCCWREGVGPGFVIPLGHQYKQILPTPQEGGKVTSPTSKKENDLLAGYDRRNGWTRGISQTVAIPASVESNQE